MISFGSNWHKLVDQAQLFRLKKISYLLHANGTGGTGAHCRETISRRSSQSNGGHEHCSGDSHVTSHDRSWPLVEDTPLRKFISTIIDHAIMHSPIQSQTMPYRSIKHHFISKAGTMLPRTP